MFLYRSRAHVIAYTHALRTQSEILLKEYCENQRYKKVFGKRSLRVYGAFSGEALGPDQTMFTEAELNSSHAKLSTADLLVVCNKLETGFDEPKLAMLYIDRALAGARCVQVILQSDLFLHELTRKPAHESSHA